MPPTVTHNRKLNGIEIRFDAKPPASTLATLHADRWRWSRRTSCWYAPVSQQAIESASRIAGEPQVANLRETINNAGLRSMTDLDSQFEDWCAGVCGR